jgi:hypothetical protein
MHPITISHCPIILNPIFCLLSDVRNLPLSLNAHISLKDFDPDFIATLLSRINYDGFAEVVLGTGCTFAITPDKRDFLTYHNVQGRLRQDQTAISGHGIVRWTLVSEDGIPLDLDLPCRHVLSAKIRLISPQDYCQYRGLDQLRDQFGGNSRHFWMNATSQQHRFQCPIDPRSNLPVDLARVSSHHNGGILVQDTPISQT